MAMDIRPGLRMQMGVQMTPQLQQAIKILQLSRLELEDFVQNEMKDNPVLEEGVLESPDEKMQVEKEAERTEDHVVQEQFEKASDIVDSVSTSDRDEGDWEFLSQMKETSSSPSATSVRKQSDEELPNYENMVTKSKTLQEHLVGQVGEQDFDGSEQRIAQLIIGNIDDRGYFIGSIQDLASSEGLDVDSVEGVLDTIQRFDPPGVAARDLKECLLIQLRTRKAKNGIVEKILDNHLAELESRNYPAIAKAMKLPIDKILENVNLIADLEPIPGRQFNSETTQYVVPDVYVFRLGDRWVVTLNEDGLPKLKVSPFYKGMVSKKEAIGKDKQYLNEKIRSADWLIKSIQQRQRTIFKVAECIVKRQQDFFDLGSQHLKPMVLKDVAEDVGVHESTISRVTNSKFMHTPRGILELTYFFNSSVSRSGGESIASESVKQIIKEIIKAENQRDPLSDQEIVELLEKREIQLARRTVAKYREQLRIPVKNLRKKHM